MASLRSIAQTLLYFQSLATCITASHVPGAPLGAAGLSLGARNSGKIAPKVFILDAVRLTHMALLFPLFNMTVLAVHA